MTRPGPGVVDAESTRGGHVKLQAFFSTDQWSPGGAAGLSAVGCGSANEEERAFLESSPVRFQPGRQTQTSSPLVAGAGTSARELATDRHARTLQGIPSDRSASRLARFCCFHGKGN